MTGDRPPQNVLVPTAATMTGGWCGIAGPPLLLCLGVTLNHAIDPPRHVEIFPLEAAVHIALFAMVPAYPVAIAGEVLSQWFERRRGGERMPVWIRFAAAFTFGTLLIAPAFVAAKLSR